MKSISDTRYVFSLIGIILLQYSVANQSAQPTYQLSDTSQQWTSTSANLFGASTFYHFDDDAFWNSQTSITALNDSHVSTLRFPGGEIGENYDWKLHRLDRPTDFPGEAPDVTSRLARTDFKEFLRHAQNAEVKNIFFVVGVDGAFRDSGDIDANLERYAKHAADWVRAVKAEGFFVPYWEVGNEPYGAGYPLTASEYAKALVVFAEKMRAADPRIKIGAAGPGGKQNFNKGIAFADKLGTDALRELRGQSGSVVKNACPKMKTAACITKLQGGSPPPPPRPWWPVIIEQARDSFDFAVIHRYERVNLKGIRKKKDFVLSTRIAKLKAWLSKQKGQPVPISLTEWNTPNERRRGELTNIEHAQEIAMQIGMNAAGGLDFAHYWPMRIKSRAFKPMFTLESTATPASDLFSLLGPIISNAQVSQSLLGKGVYALQTQQSNQEGLILVNTGIKTISVNWSHLPADRLSLVQILPARDGQAHIDPVCSEPGQGRQQTTVTLPSQSIAIVQSVRQAKP